LSLAIPTLQAREKIEELYNYDASNIASLHYQAFGDAKLAEELQNKWLMKEAEEQSRRMK